MLTMLQTVIWEKYTLTVLPTVIWDCKSVVCVVGSKVTERLLSLKQ